MTIMFAKALNEL